MLYYIKIIGEWEEHFENYKTKIVGVKNKIDTYDRKIDDITSVPT
jgi:hypothetical protein